MSTLPHPPSNPDQEKRDPSPSIPPKVDPPIDPDQEKRDPLPPSRPDVYPEEEPSDPISPAETEF